MCVKLYLKNCCLLFVSVSGKFSVLECSSPDFLEKLNVHS